MVKNSTNDGGITPSTLRIKWITYPENLGFNFVTVNEIYFKTKPGVSVLIRKKVVRVFLCKIEGSYKKKISQLC